MTRRILLGLAALALALPMTATAQAGAMDLHAQLAKVDQAWQAAYNAGDAAALTALYATDATVMAPGHAKATGHAAIQAYYAEALKQMAGAKNAVTTGETLDGGKIAVATGGWVATGADGKHLDHGTYLTVYKKVDGKWMIYLDTWNSSMSM